MKRLAEAHTIHRQSLWDWTPSQMGLISRPNPLLLSAQLPLPYLVYGKRSY